MTLVSELDLNILKTYLHTKKEFTGQYLAFKIYRLQHEQDRYTETRSNRTQYHTASRVVPVIIACSLSNIRLGL